MPNIERTIFAIILLISKNILEFKWNLTVDSRLTSSWNDQKKFPAPWISGSTSHCGWCHDLAELKRWLRRDLFHPETWENHGKTIWVSHQILQVWGWNLWMFGFCSHHPLILHDCYITYKDKWCYVFINVVINCPPKKRTPHTQKHIAKPRHCKPLPKNEPNTLLTLLLPCCDTHFPHAPANPLRMISRSIYVLKMVIFYSYVSHNQRVTPYFPPLNLHFGWFNMVQPLLSPIFKPQHFKNQWLPRMQLKHLGQKRQILQDPPSGHDGHDQHASVTHCHLREILVHWIKLRHTTPHHSTLHSFTLHYTTYPSWRENRQRKPGLFYHSENFGGSCKIPVNCPNKTNPLFRGSFRPGIHFFCNPTVLNLCVQT